MRLHMVHTDGFLLKLRLQVGEETVGFFRPTKISRSNTFSPSVTTANPWVVKGVI